MKNTIVVEHGAPTDYSTPRIEELDFSTQIIHPVHTTQLIIRKSELLANVQHGDILVLEEF